MDADFLQRLKSVGVDTDNALKRFAGNYGLYLRFLKLFLKDTLFNEISVALSEGDKDAMLSATHTLKGVAANLGMTTLCNACTDVVQKLRADDFPSACESFGAVKAAYVAVYDVIKS